MPSISPRVRPAAQRLQMVTVMIQHIFQCELCYLKFDGCVLAYSFGCGFDQAPMPTARDVGNSLSTDVLVWRDQGGCRYHDRQSVGPN